MIADVVGVGSRGPLGLSSMQVAMCARARKFEPRSIGHIKDTKGREIGACVSGGLSIHLHGYERLLALAVPAVTEACAVALSQLNPHGAFTLPVILSLPEATRPDNDDRLSVAMVEDLTDRTGLPLDANRSQVVRLGHAGGAHALDIAHQLLEEGEPAVLVGGVDSYFHPDVLHWLEEELRLHAPHIDDGFIPSEGAAFTLLARKANLPQGATMPDQAARLAAVWCAREKTIDRGEPNVAEAVSDLISLAKEGGPVSWLLSDVNGERHRVKEWTLLKVRHQLVDDFTEDRLVGELGDVGAASAAMLLNITCEYWRAACAPANRAVVLLASEGPERGLLVVEEAS